MKKIMAMILSLFICLLYFGQACSSSGGTSASSPNALSTTLAASTISVTPGSQTNIAPSTGTAPYSYTLLSGSGSVSNGVFTAPSATGTTYISIIDATGVSVIETITISTTATGTSTSTTISLAENASYTITPSSGVAPYTYVLASGTGTLSGNIFTAPAATGTSQIYVTDSTGTTVVYTFNITYASGVTGSSTTQPLYRDVNSQDGQHMSAVTANEGYPTFVTEGIIANIYTSQYTTSTIALYRCHIGDHHLTTVSAICENAFGWVLDSQIGWIDNTQQSGEIPLYRMFNSSTGDHLDTTNVSEGTANGYTYETTLGYVVSK